MHLEATDKASTAGNRAGTGRGSGDLWGGFAAALVALPSSIAFGVLVYTAISPNLAAEGARAGLFGAVALGFVAPLVSRNGGFITTPCAPAAAVLSSLAALLAARGLASDRILALLGLTILISALCQLLYGALRVGRLIKYIPYQVVTGYLSGVGLVIAIGQLPKLLGLPKGVPLLEGLVSPHTWQWSGVAVGLITMAVMFLAPRVTKRIPAAILALAAGVGAYFAIALVDVRLRQLTGNSLIIGPIPAAGSLATAVAARASSLRHVGFADVDLVFVTALMLSVLLSIDTLKTGVVLDALIGRRHNSNRELLGQGAANAAAFFLGGMAGSGAMGPTLVNFTSGGRSPWSGVTEGVVVAAIFLALSPFIAWIPIAALAGVLLVVAWNMFDRSLFRLVLQPSTRVDFAVIVTVILVAQYDLIAASATGVFLAILVFIRDRMHGSVILAKSDLRSLRSKRRRLIAESDLISRHGETAEVVQLQGDLFFGTTDQLFSDLERDLQTVRFLLLDLRKVRSMDFTAGHVLEQMKKRLDERGAELLFSGMPSNLPTHAEIELYMRQLGLVRDGHGIKVFDTRDGALEWMEDRLLADAGWKPQDEAAPLALGEIELFAKLDAATLAELGQIVREVPVPAGGRICSCGDRGDEIFFVRRGRVRALLPLAGGLRHHVATFCRGDFFGEMAFLEREPRSADLEADTAIDLYALSRGRFDAQMQVDPGLSSRVFEQLALAVSRRLRVADAELTISEER